MNENVFIAQDLPFSSSNQQSSPSVKQAAFSAVHNRNEGEENLSMSAHLNGATRQTDICFRFYMCVCVCSRLDAFKCSFWSTNIVKSDKCATKCCQAAARQRGRSTLIASSMLQVQLKVEKLSGTIENNE